MLQDTGLGQEMYIAAYNKLDKNGVKRLHCYKYTDDFDAAASDEQIFDSGFLSDRILTYCISPPGENQWARKAYTGASSSLDQQMQQLRINQESSENSSNPVIAKKFPLPNLQHTSSIVKFYNEQGESLKVGQLVEIIGIRGQDIVKHREQQEQTAEEMETNAFESILDQFERVPIIHAIAYQNLDGHISYPLVQSEQYHDIHHQAAEIRDPLVQYISNAVGGDLLAAEFILLQLVSRISVKTGELKIGNLTLNVSGFPAYEMKNDEEKKSASSHLSLHNPYSKFLLELLSQLTVHSVALPLTIDSLNKSRFTPKSVNENLEAGVLQLIDGTLLVVDETMLDEGQLVDAGVRNFQALQDLIQHQTLSYEFPYSQYRFDTDINVLSLSSTKSMLSSHCTVPLEATYPLPSMEDMVSLPEDTLNLFRKYIHTAKYIKEYAIPEDVSEYIQAAYINERKASQQQKNAELPTQEDLMLRMNLARLAAASFGEQQLTKERYEYVVNLDKQRKQRLKKKEQQQKKEAEPAIAK
ncbi:putative alanine racemase-domain-containing protein [Mycotypha africana]|uniref:putative alanine racemase-domain-containing protein n=1 Tax=Mycotypha africana TaxID=64632 RepID=UPI002300D485|nr:putative alanine racemase-domain-containing protein [Mycotypha africana]KAI8975269.1 putative alanine racemase-domain-containing protein [Mycotypha africana]